LNKQNKKIIPLCKFRLLFVYSPKSLAACQVTQGRRTVPYSSTYY